MLGLGRCLLSGRFNPGRFGCYRRNSGVRKQDRPTGQDEVWIDDPWIECEDLGDPSPLSLDRMKLLTLNQAR